MVYFYFHHPLCKYYVMSLLAAPPQLPSSAFPTPQASASHSTVGLLHNWGNEYYMAWDIKSGFPV